MKTERIVRPFGTGQITIPAEFRRLLDIGPDTLLKVTLCEGSIEIRPLELAGQARPLRDYSLEEIEQFIAEDKLDPATATKVKNLLA
jgi:AbrB family looped-hinge helix DNA binding protein